MKCETLVKFRQLAYELLGPAKDATFELLDAVMTTPRAKCLADFSLNPLFRRQWSSVYEALQDARPEPEPLMQLYIEQMPAPKRPILAVDHTLWSRPHARTLKERTYEHQPATLGGHTPVGVGLGYSTIAWIPETQGSWALPLRHERISSWDTPITKAAQAAQASLRTLAPQTFSLVRPGIWLCSVSIANSRACCRQVNALTFQSLSVCCSTHLFRSRT